MGHNGDIVRRTHVRSEQFDDVNSSTSDVSDTNGRAQGGESNVLAAALETLADNITHKEKLPTLMPEKFNGDLLMYPSWVKSFDCMIEQNCTTVSQKLFFLGKCTGPEAKKPILGYLSLDSEEAYKRARETLHKRFGDKYLLAKECRKRLKEWPQVRYVECTGIIQAPDVCWNAPFKVKYRDLYEEWLSSRVKEYNKNPRIANS